ncbi:MAG: hypothetical protein JXR40_08200 [Pontiellaceae bacterium]|nr:hypothetical protein [Pontiellaceae bacterium]
MKIQIYSIITVAYALCAAVHAQVLVGTEDFESYAAGSWTTDSAPAANPVWGAGTLSVDIIDFGTTNGNELSVGINLADQWSSGIEFNLDLTGNRSRDVSDYTLEMYARFDPETAQNLTNSSFEAVILNPNDASQASWFVFDVLDPSGFEMALSGGYTFTIPFSDAWIHYSKEKPVDASIPTWIMQCYVGNTASTNNKPIHFTIDDIAVTYTEPSFINPTGYPEGTFWANSPSLTATVTDGSNEVDSMLLYLNDELVAVNGSCAGGSSTNSISYSAIDLPGGSYTGRVYAMDATLSNSLSYAWVFNIPDTPPDPETEPLAIFNINFQGSSHENGGGLYPIPDGTVAGAPSMGSNNWFNVDYGNPWYFGWQSKTIPESSGEGPIPWITYELLEASPNIGIYIPWTWGSDQAEFTAQADGTLWATALGGANTDMNIELRDLNMDVLYDLYLYFTCPTTSYTVTTTYSITAGTAPMPKVSLSSFQKTLTQGGFEANYQINTNYVVITEIKPDNGKIGLNVSGDSYGGGVSAMQLVARSPSATMIPNIQSITSSAESLNLVWDSQSFVSYSIQTKTNLLDASWTTLSNGVMGTGASTEFSLPVSDDRRFFRIIGE